jgi:hypothetical protein
MHVSRNHRLNNLLVLESLFRSFHAGIIHMPVQPYLRERGVPMDVDCVSRVLHHPAALPVTFNDLPSHGFSRGGPHGGVTSKEKHRFNFAFWVQPSGGTPNEQLIEPYQQTRSCALVVKRRVLLLVCLLQEFRKLVFSPSGR